MTNSRGLKSELRDICSVADPYHFDTDPDPGCEKNRYGSGSRAKFDTDPDPGKNDTDPDPEKKELSTRKSLKCDEKTHIPCLVCVYYFTLTFL